MQKLAVLGAGLLLVTSCRDATQLVLNVHTNMPCSDGASWQGVAIYVGKAGRGVEETSPTLVTHSCDESGSVGSLVVTPSGDKDDEVGLRIVAGITQNPEKCAENGYEGCIVARRALRFRPHDSLELEVELTEDCVSVGCDAEHSCVRGSCIEARAIEVAALPAPSGETPELPDKTVRCGQTRCATEGDVCCLTVDAAAQTAHGECRPNEECPPTSIVLYCDDDSDCTETDEAGKPTICMLSYTPAPLDTFFPETVAGSSCAFVSEGSLGRHTGLALCETRERCANDLLACMEAPLAPTTGPELLNQMPGYHWCNVNANDPRFQ